eukprot:867788-Pelagomonas_calceolata.AAC.7
MAPVHMIVPDAKEGGTLVCRNLSLLVTPSGTTPCMSHKEIVQLDCNCTRSLSAYLREAKLHTAPAIRPLSAMEGVGMGMVCRNFIQQCSHAPFPMEHLTELISCRVFSEGMGASGDMFAGWRG